MRRKVLGLIAWMALSCDASAQTWWQDTNWYQVAANGLTVMDWAQTRYIASSRRHEEHSPLLKRQPSKTQVDLYFAGGIVLMNVVGEWLPREWGDRFYIVAAGWEGGIVAHNVSVGVRMDFGL